MGDEFSRSVEILAHYMKAKPLGSISGPLVDRPQGDAGPHLSGAIAVIESRTFLRECIQLSLEVAFRGSVATYANVSELELNVANCALSAVLLSVPEDATVDVIRQSVIVLSEINPNVPIVIFSYKNDPELVRAVLTHGAKGYIPASMGFQIAIEAVKFVLAGGTYVPLDCYLANSWLSVPPSKRRAPGAITPRELAVVRGLQQSKSNKMIAYDLNMCESTVKVHVRSVMKKLRAKNRTEVALKSSQLTACPRCVNQRECWSAGKCLKTNAADVS